MSDYAKADEELYERARQTMFAYLAGLIKGRDRDQLTAMYATWHAEHAGGTKRYGACAECEKHAALAFLRESPLLQVIKKPEKEK